MVWGLCGFVSDVREIGDVHEGVVEGGEDASHAEDEFACTTIDTLVWWFGFWVDEMGVCRPSLTCGPREMFSCAVRSTFFLGAISAVVLLTVYFETFGEVEAEAN